MSVVGENGGSNTVRNQCNASNAEPNAAADGGGILAFRGTLSSLPAPLLSWLLGRLRRASGEVESGCGPGVALRLLHGKGKREKERK
jgi:hypothetical protein